MMCISTLPLPSKDHCYFEPFLPSMIGLSYSYHVMWDNNWEELLSNNENQCKQQWRGKDLDHSHRQ